MELIKAYEEAKNTIKEIEGIYENKLIESIKRNNSGLHLIYINEYTDVADFIKFVEAKMPDLRFITHRVKSKITDISDIKENEEKYVEQEGVINCVFIAKGKSQGGYLVDNNATRICDLVYIFAKNELKVVLKYRK